MTTENGGSFGQLISCILTRSRFSLSVCCALGGLPQGVPLVALHALSYLAPMICTCPQLAYSGLPRAHCITAIVRNTPSTFFSGIEGNCQGEGEGEGRLRSRGD